MRLAKITLSGFKSFADRTQIKFDQPITAIVGPNGCGKSNVVDAIKWVLGEQSAKSLRGGAMLDVIFNGSSARKPAGLASVTLHFDNPADDQGQRLLPLDHEQVALTRRLYRDGTSEYLINNQRARLRDIKELFFDTGIGTNAYSIIEQGKVDAMLVSNPQERRVIFEEAAGIAKFKQRKKEAARKLDRTEQNLLRSRDKLEETQKRLRSVRAQASKARNYREHDERLSELRLAHSLAEYHRMTQQHETLRHELSEAQQQREQATAALNERETQRDEAELNRQQVLGRQRELENQRSQTQSAQQQAEQRCDFADRAMADLESDITRDQQRHQQAQQREQQLRQQSEQARVNEQRIAEQIESINTRIEQAQESHRALQHEINETKSQLEDERAGTITLIRRSTELQNEVHRLEAEQRNLQSQREKLNNRAEELAGELTDLLNLRDETAQQHEEVCALINAENTRLEQQKQTTERLSAQQQELGETLAKLREKRSGFASRQTVLLELEQAQTGVDEAVRTVLARRDASVDQPSEQQEFTCVKGLVADFFETEVEHAPYVEAALAEDQQKLIVERQADLRDAHDQLQSLHGRVRFLAMDQLPPLRMDRPISHWLEDSQISVALLIDLVSYPAHMADLAWALLGRTLLVDNDEQAWTLHERLRGHGYRLLSKSSGMFLEDHGGMTMGPLSESAGAGLISRRSELAEIENRLSDIDQRITHAETELAEVSDQSTHAHDLQKQLRTTIYENSTMRIELASKLERLNDQISKIQREQPIIAKEVQDIYDRLHEADTSHAGHGEQIEALQSQAEQSRQRVEQLQNQLDEKTEQAGEAHETLTTARVEAGRLNEQLISAKTQQRNADLALEDCVRHQHELIEQLEHHRKRIDGLTQQRRAAVMEVDQAESQLEQITEQLAQVQRQVAEAEEHRRALSGAVNEARQALQKHEQTLHDLQMRDKELEVHLDHLCNAAMENLQLDLREAYADYEPVEMDWDAVAAEIKELSAKLKRLGHVNLDAIDEQDELEKREQFLSEQVRDVDQARIELEKLIKHLNEKSRNRFQETFEQVRENFAGSHGMFRKLFGGGRADIELIPDEEGHVDVLEAGIQIIAKPPGKEPQSINLLSGGERTMVAVALLMSIFKSRPSPFCILDEVDAALDEANVERFANILHGFLDQSHFILITHNKRTMATADLLYGITMPQRGVSKRVQVRFDQVSSDGKIDPDAIKQSEAEDESEAEDAWDDTAPVPFADDAEQQSAPEEQVRIKGKNTTREKLAEMFESSHVEPVDANQ